jgi:hypothetical protein
MKRLIVLQVCICAASLLGNSLVAATNNLSLGATYRGTISEPGEEDYFLFTGSPGQRLYYDALDRDFDNIYVRLLGPNGNPVFLSGGNSDSDAGPYVLTEPGTYALVINGTGDQVGNYDFRLVDLALAVPLTLGTVVSNQLSPRTETDVYRFNGTAGQRIRLTSVSGGAGGQASWELFSPANLSMVSAQLTTDLGDVVLPLSGAYYLLIEGNVSNSVPLLYEVLARDISDAPVAASGFGVEQSGSIGTGQTNTLTLTAPAGLPIFFDSLQTGASALLLELRDSLGNQVFSGDGNQDLGPFVLPRSGSYSLVVRGSTASSTGNYRFRVLDLTTAPTLPFNTSVSNVLALPYEVDVYQFAGSAGQRLVYDAIDADSDNVQIRLRSPSFIPIINQNSDNDSAPFVLPLSGTYYFFVESALATSPNYDFQMFDLASRPTLPLDTDLVGTLNPGRSMTLYQLSGTAGQRLYFDGKGGNSGGNWYLYAPNNAFVSSANLINDFELTLGYSGTYLLQLDGNSASPVTYSNRVITFGFSTNVLALGTTISNVIATPGEKIYYTFTGSAGQRLYYDALDGDFDGINVQLLTPSGAVRFINANSDSDVGPFTLNENGVYTLAFDGSGNVTGDYIFRLLGISAQPVVPFDADLTVSLNPGRGAIIYQLPGVTGQRLFFDGKGGNSGGNWYLYNPFDTYVNGANFVNDFEEILSLAGMYVLLFDGNSASPVLFSNRVVTFNFVTNALTPGTIVSNVIAKPGEQVFYTFAGQAGQRLFYDALDGDGESISVRLYSPNGVVRFINNNSETDVGPFTLAETGTWTLALDGNGQAIGDYIFRLLDVDVQPVLPFDADIVNTLTLGYGATLYRFSGTIGQSFYFDGRGNNSSANWYLYGPADAQVNGANIVNDFEIVLPLTGNYVLALLSSGASAVNHTNNVITFAIGTVPLALGIAVTNNITEPGEQDIYTFTGTVGQRLYFDALDYDFDGISVRLQPPSGTLRYINGNSDSDVGPFTLNEGGTYSLVVDGNGQSTGDYSFRLLDLASAPSLPLGTTTSGQLDTRTETDLFVFTGTAGQRLNLDSISASASEANWSLFNPVNVNLRSGNIVNDLGEVVLPLSGTYCLAVVGGGSSTSSLSYQFNVSDLSDTPVAASGFDIMNSGNIAAGQTNSFSYTGSAGLPIYFDSEEPNSSSLIAELRDTTGTAVFLVGASADAGPYVLPRSGTYTLSIRANSAGGTGAYRFRLLDLTSAPVLNSNTVVNVLSPGYKTDVYRFTALAGQRLYYDALDNDGESTFTRLWAPNETLLINQNASSDAGPLTLAHSGTYYLFLSGNQAADNDYSFRLLDVNSQPVLPLDTPVTNNFASYGAVLYRYDAVAGENLFFDSLSSGVSGSFYLYGPSDNTLSGVGLTSDFEITLGTSGRHVLIFESSSPNPQTNRFQVVTITNPTNALTLGTVVSNVIGEAGQNVAYTFTGAVGQRIYYDALQADADQIYVQLFNPAGTIANINHNADSDVGPFTLAVAGTYTLVFYGLGDETGNFAFRLLDVNSQPVLPLDAPVTNNFASYGAVLYRYDGSAGPNLFFDSLSSGASATWYLYGPLDAQISGAGLAGDFEVTLATTGRHVLVFDSSNANPQTNRFQVVTITNPTNALTLGTTVSNIVSQPGQNVNYTFTGTAGQRLYYDALQSDPDQIYVQLINPQGTVVQINHNADSDVGPFTLLLSGTYTLVFYGQGDETGNFVFRLLDMDNQPALPLDTLLTNALPGYSVALFRYDGFAGQNLFFDSLTSSGVSGTWYLYGPADAQINGAGQTGDFEVMLATSGRHLLLFDSSNANAQTNRFRVVTINEGTDPSANRAPVLAAIGPRRLPEGVNLSFTASATDLDGNALVYSLDPGAPVGATINPSGFFSYTPPVTLTSRFEFVTVRVTDNGQPISLDAAETVPIKVVAVPFLTRVIRTPTNATIIWRSAPQEQYQLQYKNDLGETNWTNLGGVITGTNFTTSFLDTTTGTNWHRFYQLILFY